VRFWDASAIIPLCVTAAETEAVRSLAGDDPQMVVWWGSRVECWSAFARKRREGVLDPPGEEAARSVLTKLYGSWTEILPGEELRLQAARLLRLHPLLAHDALQLAAALTWAGHPQSGEIVAFDRRLLDAARLEGLTPLP